MRQATRALLFERLTLTQFDRLIKTMEKARDDLIKHDKATYVAGDGYHDFTPVYREIAQIEDELRAARNVEGARRRI